MCARDFRRLFASPIATAVGAFAILASLLLCVTPAKAEKRVALVIGNSAYVNVPRLANPANDARLMADTLRSLGFTLVGGGAQLDLDEHALRRIVQDFGSQLQGADVGLFYYAGHGVQVRGENYLVPVDANPTKEADVDFQMLDANLVLRQMESAGTKLNLVLLDACRNNPLAGRGLRTVAAGLGQMQAPEGTLISFATQPGSVAQDGTGGDSPYTEALAQTMIKPGLDVFRTFNEVGVVVAAETHDAQQPWLSLSPIKGDFYFAGAPKSPPQTAKSSSAPPTGEERAREDYEAALQIGTKQGWEAFLIAHPTGFYADLARSQRSKITASVEPTNLPSKTLEPKPSDNKADKELPNKPTKSNKTTNLAQFSRHQGCYKYRSAAQCEAARRVMRRAIADGSVTAQQYAGATYCGCGP